MPTAPAHVSHNNFAHPRASAYAHTRTHAHIHTQAHAHTHTRIASAHQNGSAHLCARPAGAVGAALGQPRKRALPTSLGVRRDPVLGVERVHGLGLQLGKAVHQICVGVGMQGRLLAQVMRVRNQRGCVCVGCATEGFAASIVTVVHCAHAFSVHACECGERLCCLCLWLPS